MYTIPPPSSTPSPSLPCSPLLLDTVRLLPHPLPSVLHHPDALLPAESRQCTCGVGGGGVLPVLSGVLQNIINSTAAFASCLVHFTEVRFMEAISIVLFF